MPTKIDTLELMGFNRPGFCNNGSYTITLDNLKMLLQVKNPQGFPIDVMLYDNDYVYDKQTEASWKDPGFIKFHLGNNGLGNRMAPRYLTKFPWASADVSSPLNYIKNGQTDYIRYSAGPVSRIWQPPLMMNWGGQIGNTLTYPHDYYWSGVSHLEKLYFVPGWGRVKWTGYVLKNGKYVIEKPEDDPPVNNKLMTVRDWQRTYPDLKEFSYKFPFLTLTPLA